jgi:hypothetical protein
LQGANDATVVSGSSGPGGGTVSSRTLKGYRASCIVYTGDAAPSAPSSAPPPVAPPQGASPPAP